MQDYALTAFSYEDVGAELIQEYDKKEEPPEEPEEPEEPEPPKEEEPPKQVEEPPKEEVKRLPVTGM